MKKLTNLFLSFALAFTVFAFVPPTPTALADSGCPPVTNLVKSIKIPASGDFKVATPPIDFGCTKVIRSVVISLSPKDTTGTINSINITRSDAVQKSNPKALKPPVSTEFGCVNAKVKTGDDLTLICGGPAVLEPGFTVYQASGSGFASKSNPGSEINLSVTLNDTYSDQYKKVYGTAEDSTVKSVQDLYGL
ncbi:hypothetical protein Lepto7376_3341 [[Leptolyngbya] sp. PCC 7376]|uniref:hypothetical protein n=1 Tax=[Leptolyngbya] sp. PCC 7376 TaxID=111781 RepID=UPI00029ED572|nr:hypothetical protein [[Leptolyngbya] sp. PCC 7376]AFY39558.1 hypothetical protein Lepto7376_3341 [[Leptolyngbya] sp. PCC 7376]